MLTDIDVELYAGDCEVVEIPPHGHFYLMQKNGSTSLDVQSRTLHGNRYVNHDIGQLERITVLIRDPLSRFASGVHTFAEHLCRDYPDLDRDTCVWMACRYRFLNRHYLPQFHWILNIARYLDSKCILDLRPFETLSNLVTVHEKKSVASKDHIKKAIESYADNKLWLFLDQILRDNMDSQMTWHDLLDLYRAHPARPLDVLRGRTPEIFNVLS